MLFLTSLWHRSRFCWFDDVGAHGAAKAEQGALPGANQRQGLVAQVACV